ncbi:MAG: hypothetical protein KBT39_00440 [Bacteroidales bacterium]|nr:hypothetical protein [Bacteroidales bacterium]
MSFLNVTEDLIEVSPDSAFHLLGQLNPDQLEGISQRERNSYFLLRAKAQNKAFIPFEDDSLMLSLVSYYDSKGSANERVLSNYMLGCVYRDLAEAPNAISCFQKAINSADTLSAECDNRLLSSVYSQMAELWGAQLLWNDEIRCREQSVKYSLMANDTLNALYDFCLMASAYFKLNEPTKAEKILLKAKEEYEKLGEQQEWLDFSIILIALYTEKIDEFDKARSLINEYEAKTVYVDDQGVILPQRRHLYSYKAHYFEHNHELDSALYYYAKSVHPDMQFPEFDLMYRGLLRVYQEMNEPDSIAKYAALYCMFNDSSIALTDREITKRMTSLYNYNRFAQMASEQQQKAKDAIYNMMLVVSFFLLFAVSACTTILLMYRSKKRKQQELEDTLNRYTEACKRLEESKSEQHEKEKYYIQLSATLQEELTDARLHFFNQEEKCERLQNDIEALAELRTRETEKYIAYQNALEKEIEQLLRNEHVREMNNRTISFKNSLKVRYFKDVANDPRKSLTEEDWDELIELSGQHFPTFLHDLRNNPNLSSQAIKVAVLTLVKMHEGEMANLLSVNKQRISNIKSEINKKLFGETSAKSLYGNLTKNYLTLP